MSEKDTQPMKKEKCDDVMPLSPLWLQKASELETLNSSGKTFKLFSSFQEYTKQKLLHDSTVILKIATPVTLNISGDEKSSIFLDIYDATGYSYNAEFEEYYLRKRSELHGTHGWNENIGNAILLRAINFNFPLNSREQVNNR